MTGLRSSDALLVLLRIEQSDILANRDGHLGATQRRQAARMAVILPLVLVVLGGALIGGGFLSRSNGGDTFVPWFMGAVIVILGIVFAWSSRNAPRVPVQRFTGQVQVGLVAVGRGAEVRLWVSGQTCRPPTRLRSTIDAWEAAIDPARIYHVYVVGTANGVVGVEMA